MVHQSVNSQAVTCPSCLHDANPLNALYCEVCGYCLLGTDGQSQPNSFKRFLDPRWLALGGLLFLTSLGYIIWKNQMDAPKPAITLTRATDIKLYPSLGNVEVVPQGTFDYAGAVTFANLTAHGMNEAIAKAHPSFQLRYSELPNRKPGTGTAISMLLDKKTSFAQTARPLKPEEYALANGRGFGLEQIPVFLDGIAFYTHPGIQIPGLSLDQIQAIFTGAVTNWQQVGGPDFPIKAFSQDPKASSVIDIILGDENRLGSNVSIIYNITDAIRSVAKTPGGISYSSPSLVIHQKSVRPLGLAATSSQQYIQFTKDDGQLNAAVFKDGTYPLTRHLFVVFRRDGTVAEKAGVAYTNLLLSKEGQQIIEKAGFVSILK